MINELSTWKLKEHLRTTHGQKRTFTLLSTHPIMATYFLMTPFSILQTKHQIAKILKEDVTNSYCLELQPENQIDHWLMYFEDQKIENELMTKQNSIKNKNVLITFKPNSPLYNFLTANEPTLDDLNVPEYSLWYITIILRRLFYEKKLYDDTNDKIIICDEQVQRAINCKFLFDEDIEHAIMIQASSKLYQKTSPFYTQQNINKFLSKDPSIIQHKDINTIFVIREKFRPLILDNHCNGLSSEFSLKDIVDVVRLHLLKNKHLIHKQNKTICHCEGDKLQTIFRVKTFHMSQVIPFIFREIILEKSHASVNISQINKI